MKTTSSGFKPYLKLTFLIGFGFFTMGLMDPLYDTYVPIFLGKYVGSMTLVGLIMTLDNIFALFLIPLSSVVSDRTVTKIGRRMPFIITLLPLTAIFFGALPYAASISLGALVALIFGLNLAKQSARGPVVALMPDIIPAAYRSEANGVINTMGGIATIVGTIGLARLMDIDIVLPLLGPTKDRLPFPLAGLLVAIAVALLYGFVKEKHHANAGSQGGSGSDGSNAKAGKEPILASFKAVAAQTDKSAFYILISLFLWFLGYQGVLPFIGTYSLRILGTSSGTAALAAGMVGVAYAIFAIPSGYVAHRIGRKKTIRISLATIVGLTVLLYFHDPVTAGLSDAARLYSFWAIMFCFGIFWVSVVTNSFPMLWQMASWGTMGVYTGLYYTASQGAAIMAPILTGALIDTVGYRGIFLFCSACMAAAFAVMSLVRAGEPDAESK